MNPPCNRKSRSGKPPPTAERALLLSQPESPCRRRLQTAISCFGPKTAVVNVMVKRRDRRSRHVGIRERDECGAADKAENLARCKSSYCQLPGSDS